MAAFQGNCKVSNAIYDMSGTFGCKIYIFQIYSCSTFKAKFVRVNILINYNISGLNFFIQPNKELTATKPYFPSKKTPIIIRTYEKISLPSKLPSSTKLRFRCSKCLRAICNNYFRKDRQIKVQFTLRSLSIFLRSVLIKKLTRCTVVTLEFPLPKIFTFNFSECKGVRFNKILALLEI